MTAWTTRSLAPGALVLGLAAALVGCESGFKLDVGPSDPEVSASAAEDGRPSAPAEARPVPASAPAETGGADPARYADVLAELEPWEIYRRCAALVAVRDHRRFDICFEILTERIGDGTLDESGFGGRAWNRAATEVRLQELRAESWLDRGELDRAEEAALAAARVAEDDPNYAVEGEAAEWLSNLVSRADYGDPDQPFAHLRLRPLGLATAIAARRGDTSLARAYLAEIEGFDPALGGPGHAALWRRWKAIGHFVLGDFEEAYQTLNRGPDMGVGGPAYRSLVEIGAADPDAGPLLPASADQRPLDPRFVMELEHDFMRLRSALETGRQDVALEGLDDLLADDRLKGHPAIHARVLRDRGRVAAEEGAHEGAIASYVLAIELIEGSRSTDITGAGKLGAWDDRQAVYADMIASQIATGQADAAFDYAERARTRALVDRLATVQRFAAAPAGIVDLLARQAAFEEGAALLAWRSADRWGAQAGEAAALQEALRRDAPDLAGLVFVDAPPAGEIRARLAQGEVLLAYFQHRDRLFGFAVAMDGVSARELDGEDLDVLVDGFLRAIRNPRRRAYISGARRLYAGLVRPFAAELEARRLVIVPHGAVARLPFAALRDDSGYLIDTYALRILPSARLLSGADVPAPSPGRGLLLLDPPEPGQPSPDLPGAPLETAAVERAWPGAVLAVGRGATETLLKARGGTAGHLHLAARCADDPALLLAGDGENDGRLTVPELYAITLEARLAVLSRCHAGTGAASDVGLAELSEAFLRAGAGAVTVSLWPVADDVAAGMMQRLYGNLLSGVGTEALRNAQRETAGIRSHPYYWAGFQWIGADGGARPPGAG